MKRTLFYLIIFTGSIGAFSQNILQGTIIDSKTKETLIGANIILIDGTGTSTNLDGEFIFNNIDKGTYSASISYVGYENKEISIAITKQVTTLNLELKSIVLDIINIVGDVAQFRKTPVSLSNVALKKIDNELAGQEIPTLLTSTPSVYATQQGGGDGDVRINIRGFNQRNVAVMIDGVPMNDMENGWVYWSNWFGLDAMTSNIQVQRGLGASKLAIPSIGGTINIITQTAHAKEGGRIKQEIGNDGYLRTSFGYTTKNNKIGKVSLAFSAKQYGGMVDQTPSKGFFYYLKWQKQIKNHLFSASIFGAPQEHAQRKYQTGAAVFDKDYANSIGIDTTGLEGNYGLNYNPNWGEYNNYQVAHNGNSIDTIWGETQKINSHINYYHKPNINFQHLWEINENQSLTNVIYYSNGNGGGTGLSSQGSGADGWTNENQINFQYIYDSNSGNIWNSFINPGGPAIDLAYSDTEKKSAYILYSSINNHYWGGLLSTYNTKIYSNLDLALGIDLRSYRGEHYREVYDLIGGDYYAGSMSPGKNSVGENSNELMLREGDKIYYHNDGLVKWTGGFGQLEYENGNISTFINLTASHTAYKRVDYFKKRDIVLEDTILSQAVGINDTIIYNGEELTIRPAETEWESFNGITGKIGANWNIDEYNNIFFNTGILSKAPRFNNVFNYDNQTYYNTKNELIKAFEIGYGYRSNKLSVNINTYYTIWENKPQAGSTVLDGGELASYNINGINALHKGIELDLAWKISNSLKYEFMSSIGDWRWTSGDTVNLYLNQQLVATDYFDANGVYVGDAPQTQIGSSISYNFSTAKNSKSYIKLKGVYFDRFFSDYEPFTLNKENEVWQIPSYMLMSLHIGNTIYYQNSSISGKINILNLLNTTYISDAENNSSYVEDTPMNSDAASASVFFGLGRKIIASLEYKF